MKVNEYYRASTLADAYSKLNESINNSIIGGGLWMKKTGLTYNALIDLSALGLNKIEDKGDEVVVGALVTLRDFESSELIKSLYSGAIAFAVREVMGVNLRNLATIGGSIMGRYPFSDVITGLLPYEVNLEFYPENKMSLEEYLFYKGKLNAILTHIHIKKSNGKGFYKKVKRTALDFPILNIAVSKVNNKFSIVIGARPAGASKAIKAMEFINNIANPTLEDFAKAGEKAIEELNFLDNKDSSKEYRMDLAKVYVRRGLEEVNK